MEGALIRCWVGDRWFGFKYRNHTVFLFFLFHSSIVEMDGGRSGVGWEKRRAEKGDGGWG